MIDFQKIKKECFWEYDFDEKEIKDIVNSDDFQRKKFIFEKILLNSSTLFKDLKIFSRDDLEKLLLDFKVPSFNYEYIFKRKNMAEVYFFDKPLLVNELKWVA